MPARTTSSRSEGRQRILVAQLVLRLWFVPVTVRARGHGFDRSRQIGDGDLLFQSGGLNRF
jgi:hypothetical protein